MSKVKRRNYHSKPLMILALLLLVNNVIISQDKALEETVRIPEPLMFDLVRGLGANKGELEINTLVDLPLNNASSRGVDWAPEIEYALFDNFAVELEFPLNNLEFEAFKMAIQWTIGSSQNNTFIHGFQAIGEKYFHYNLLEISLLYVPAYRFNEVWSAIGLFGIMLESGDDTPQQNYTIILNASVFADLNEHIVIGLEINNSDPTFQRIDNNNMELLILPQVHYEFDRGYSFQFGIGSKFYEGETEFSAVLRAIKSF